MITETEGIARTEEITQAEEKGQTAMRIQIESPAPHVSYTSITFFKPEDRGRLIAALEELTAHFCYKSE